MTLALRVLARVILIYIWNVDLVLAFENADERNLFLVMLLRMARWMINSIEARNRDIINNRFNPANNNNNDGDANNNNVINNDRPGAAPLPRRMPDAEQARPDHRARVRPLRPLRPRGMAGLDLNNVLNQRLRNRNNVN